MTGRLEREPPTDAGRRFRAGALVVAGAALSCLVAATTPFSVAADVAVALPIALVVTAVVAAAVVDGRGAPGARRPRWRRPRAAHPTLLAAAPWLALAAAVVAWELFCLFAGPRATYPTVSSMYDALARWRAAKALVVFAWLALGWYLVRR